MDCWSVGYDVIVHPMGLEIHHVQKQRKSKSEIFVAKRFPFPLPPTHRSHAVDSEAFTCIKVIMAWMIAMDCCGFQLLTPLRVGREETRTDGAIELIWLLVRPELALPRVAKVCGVMVWMLDARAAETCGICNAWSYFYYIIKTNKTKINSCSNGFNVLSVAKKTKTNKKQ